MSERRDTFCSADRQYLAQWLTELTRREFRERGLGTQAGWTARYLSWFVEFQYAWLWVSAWEATSDGTRN